VSCGQNEWGIDYFRFSLFSLPDWRGTVVLRHHARRDDVAMKETVVVECKKTGREKITISVDVKNGRGPWGRRQKRLIDCRKRLKILSWFNIVARDLVGGGHEERLIVTMASSTFSTHYSPPGDPELTLVLIIAKTVVLLHRLTVHYHNIAVAKINA